MKPKVGDIIKDANNDIIFEIIGERVEDGKRKFLNKVLHYGEKDHTFAVGETYEYGEHMYKNDTYAFDWITKQQFDKELEELLK